MSAKKHPEYKKEKERLEYTIDYMEMVIRATDENRIKYKGNIKEAYENLDSEDGSESYVNILLNYEFLAMSEKTYDSLKRTKDKPYFARIDVKKNENDSAEAFYIGKTSLFRAEDNEPIIIDWRSPIANVYYDGRLGKVSYQSEEGNEEVDLVLKRQFTIENGKLENIMDIDLTTTDEFLQASLEASADDKLKDIAATIQGEQNKVIRAEIDRPLIVQGAAGSGKTTIALHRIAYFIYTYEKIFDPDNFMIMAPNQLFINYISEVLPELGVEQVKQTTYIDFIREVLGNKYKLTDPNEKLIELIQSKSNLEEENLIKWGAAFKGTMDFKEIVDKFVENLERSFTPKKDFAISHYVIMTAEEIENMFLHELRSIPLYKRVPEIKKSLTNRLKLRKNMILNKTEQKYDNQIAYLRRYVEETEERRLKIVELIDRRDEVLERLKKEIKTSVKKYIDLFPKGSVYEYYKELMSNEEFILKYTKDVSKEKAKFLCSDTMKRMNGKKIEVEDCGALLYLKHKIFGFDKKLTIKNIVIDEAQDFSVFQLYSLKEALKTNMFTILGDLSQGIYAYRSIHNWEEVLEKVFPNANGSYMTLKQTYRTTIEVMELANEVIKKLKNDKIILANPVIRHGEKPQIKEFAKEEDLILTLEKRIKEMKKQNYKSMAIICKTHEECKKVKKYLGKNISSTVLTGREDEYPQGVIIVPSHLAKGLEFDVVFIVNVDEKYTMNDLDIKLLYVAMTRTLHRLHIYYKKGLQPIMEEIL